MPRRVKWFDFSVGTMEVKHQTHRYSEGRSASGPMFIRGFPYVVIIPRRIEWFQCSVGTMEVKHQTHRHSNGRSASGPMFMRGFPPYDYSMTVSTPIHEYFIARCELFRVE